MATGGAPERREVGAAGHVEVATEQVKIAANRLRLLPTRVAASRVEAIPGRCGSLTCCFALRYVGSCDPSGRRHVATDYV